MLLGATVVIVMADCCSCGGWRHDEVDRGASGGKDDSGGMRQ